MRKLYASTALAALMALGAISAPSTAQAACAASFDVNHDRWLDGQERAAARASGVNLDPDGNFYITQQEYDSCLGGMAPAAGQPTTTTVMTRSTVGLGTTGDQAPRTGAGWQSDTITPDPRQAALDYLNQKFYGSAQAGTEIAPAAGGTSGAAGMETQGTLSGFDALDRNGDGVITRDEYPSQ